MLWALGLLVNAHPAFKDRLQLRGSDLGRRVVGHYDAVNDTNPASTSQHTTRIPSVLVYKVMLDLYHQLVVPSSVAPAWLYSSCIGRACQNCLTSFRATCGTQVFRLRALRWLEEIAVLAGMEWALGLGSTNIPLRWDILLRWALKVDAH